MRNLRYHGLWVLTGITMLLIVFYLCLKAPDGGAESLLPDKLAHALAFFALTAWFAALVERRFYLYVVVLMLSVGVGIEIAQGIMALGRSAELADVYADATGIALGILISLTIRDSWFERCERWLPRN